MSELEQVQAHYEREKLTDVILNALWEAGIHASEVTPEVLSPIDQFHMGGKGATLDLLNLANVTAETRVLDVGGGIGGPARTIAAATGAKVTVLDLSTSFVDAGEVLTMLCGMANLVTFVQGNALSMSFPDSSFDLVWTQHSSMNIDDKDGLFREFARVLKPGSKLAIHEVVAGSNSPVHFPVPWSREPATSFLRTADATLQAITAAGFRQESLVDLSQSAIAFWHERFAAAKAQPGTPKLGLHILLGADFPVMGKNTLRNLEEDRIRVLQGVFVKG